MNVRDELLFLKEYTLQRWQGGHTMSIQECYAAIEGDFEGTLGRLGSEKLVERFALKFLADESYPNLIKAMGEENYENAFRAAHTLKGVGLNLGFTRLHEASDLLTEALRGGSKPEDNTLLENVKAAYERTVTVLREYQGA